MRNNESIERRQQVEILVHYNSNLLLLKPLCGTLRRYQLYCLTTRLPTNRALT